MFRSRSLTLGWKEEIDEYGIGFHKLTPFKEVDYLFENSCNERHTQIVRTFLNPMLLNIDIPLSNITVSDSFVFTLMYYVHETSRDYIIRDYKNTHSMYIYLPKENSIYPQRFFLSILNRSLEEYLPFVTDIVHSLVEDVLKITRHETFLSTISYLEKCIKLLPRYDRMEAEANDEQEYLYIGPYYFLVNKKNETL